LDKKNECLNYKTLEYLISYNITPPIGLAKKEGKCAFSNPYLEAQGSLSSKLWWQQ